MNKIFQVLSNLKHDGDLLVKGTLLEAPLYQFETLVREGVLRIVEGASNIAEAADILAKEAAQSIEEGTEPAAPAPQDTWAPTKEPVVAPEVPKEPEAPQAPVSQKYTVLKEFEITNTESKNFGTHAVGAVIVADPVAAQALVDNGTLSLVTETAPDAGANL